MRYKKYKNYNKKNTGKKIDKVVASILAGLVGFAALGGVGYYGYTQYDKLNNEKQELVIQNTQLTDKVNELINNEYTITEKSMAWVTYNPVGNMEQFLQRGDCPVGHISYDKNAIKSEIIDTVINQYTTGSLLEIENYGSLPKQDNTYQVSQDCENIVEIYDVTGRLVDFTELKDDVSYTLGLTHKATFADDNTVTKVITRIDLAETIEVKENIVELKSGTYVCADSDVKDYFVVDMENGTVDYYYMGETLSNGTISQSNGVLTMVITDSEIDCEFVENGFIFGDYTFTYQEEVQSKGYVGSWTYTQVGEGDTGLSDGDIFNMTINEDKTISMTLYNAVSGQTDNVDLSQADITELENGLKLTFQEDEVHMLTLVDENTLHVSLYDDSIKFDAIRVTE